MFYNHLQATMQLLALLCIITAVAAIPAPPKEVLQKLYPEDHIYTQGDTCCNYMTDEDDDLVVYDEASTQFKKVVAHHEGRLLWDVSGTNIPTASKVEILREYCSNKNDACADQIGPVFNINAIQTTGNLKNLIVLMKFSDHTSRPSFAKEHYDVVANSLTTNATYAPTGSLKTYYLHQSFNQMVITSVVTDWVTVPYTEAFAADGCSSLCYNSGGSQSNLHIAITDALNQLDSTIDFTQFDSDSNGIIDLLTIIHSGYGAEFGGTDAYGAIGDDRIWSHKWALGSSVTLDGIYMRTYNVNAGKYGRTGENIVRIGLLAHEMGHVFGLPDLYDTTSPYSLGISYYSIMANSYGVDGSMLYPGSMDPWCRIQLGWANVETLIASKTVQTEPVQTAGHILKITNNFPSNEYLLIEARSNDASISIYDSLMPGGFYVWHIDNSVSTYNSETSRPGLAEWPATHMRVRLIQKDNLYELERGVYTSSPIDDVYTQTTDVLDDFSIPDLLSYEQLAASSCLVTGNSLTNFVYSASSNSTFDYTKHERVTCSAGTYAPTTVPTTRIPSTSPTVSPTRSPTVSPTKSPSKSPTVSPTNSPTVSPTISPTNSPTSSPTRSPTGSPTTKVPTSSPTLNPTRAPSNSPIRVPTSSPTLNPTKSPSSSPIPVPTTSPTLSPTKAPSPSPIVVPTSSPTTSPSKAPTSSPTQTQVHLETPVDFMTYYSIGGGSLFALGSAAVVFWWFRSATPVDLPII